MTGWQDISTAPKDSTGILAYANGADNRPVRAIVHWGCAKHVFLSFGFPCHPVEGQETVGAPGCDMQFLGDDGRRYGVDFTHWMHLPDPPEEKGKDTAGK